jgi:hypothetical protein
MRRPRVVDAAELPLRRDALDELRAMPLGAGDAEDVVDRLVADGAELIGEGLAVVDVVGAVVSGSAAASAKPRLFGMRPTMRSSTRWISAFVPGRAMLPAYQTLSPGLKSRHSAPVAATTPTPPRP